VGLLLQEPGQPLFWGKIQDAILSHNKTGRGGPLEDVQGEGKRSRGRTRLDALFSKSPKWMQIGGSISVNDKREQANLQ
jgi:hypothetical protein